MHTFHGDDSAMERLVTSVLLTLLFVTGFLITLLAPVAMYDLVIRLP